MQTNTIRQTLFRHCRKLLRYSGLGPLLLFSLLLYLERWVHAARMRAENRKMRQSRAAYLKSSASLRSQSEM